MENNGTVKEKYLFVIPRMGNGGAERVMATLANEFSEQNKEIIILSLTSDQSFYELADNVQIIGAGYKIDKSSKLLRYVDMGVNGIASLFYIHKVIKLWKPNIVISFLTHTNLLTIILKIFKPSMKLVVSERCEPWVRSYPIKLATKFLYPLANSIVCQSNVVATFFPRYAQNKIKIIPNPINVESISEKIFSEKRKVIIGVGRLFEQKNFELLINSFFDISEEFPEHTLEIYGEGHLRENLQSLINDLELNNRVFLKGVKNNVIKYVANSELFVMSSDYEGFPNVLIEAMASGMPVISTDFSTGVAKDLVKQNNGILVPVGNRKLMSQAMRTILSDSNKQKIMSKENRKIKDRLSTQEILKEWTSVFSQLN